MWLCIQTIGIVGFLICLALMYLTDLGVRGIRRYDSSFHSPDMKFHYSVKQVMETFERIGETGRLIYQKYLILDCLFTLFFLIVMLAITNKLITNPSVGNILFVVCVLRAIFDLLENGFLIKVLKKYPEINKSILKWCSYFTTTKFLCLYLWIAVLIINDLFGFF